MIVAGLKWAAHRLDWSGAGVAPVRRRQVL